jgi:molecular chaperone DnaJ
MDHYETLGVRSDADAAVIKAAFRALALEHHPDKGGAAAVFQRVNAAHEELSDPLRRCIYDATRPMPRATREARAAEAAAERAAEAAAGAGASPSGGDSSPPPPSTEGRAWSQRRPRREGYRGADQVVAFPLTLEQMYNGYVQHLPLQRRVVCPSCRGAGVRPGCTRAVCELCGGQGAQGRQCESCGMRNWWGPVRPPPRPSPACSLGQIEDARHGGQLVPVALAASCGRRSANSARHGPARVDHVLG